MKAEYRGYLLHALDGEHLHAANLETLTPVALDNFVLDMDFYASPVGTEGFDAFSVRICSSKWFIENQRKEIFSLKHHIIMTEFNSNLLVDYLCKCCSAPEAETWEALALKIGAIGKWEFDYRT